MHLPCPTPISLFLPRLLATLALALSGTAALAQADPPARVARLSHSEGSIVFSHAGDREWTELPASRPITRGDRLWTDGGARAELQLGATTVRMGGQTLLDVKQLDGQAVDLGVARGSVSARLRSLGDGDSFEIDTPNLAFRATEPGHYRVDVDPVSGTTRVTVLTGAGTAYGASGQAAVLGGGQQASFRDKDLTRVSSQEAPPLDNFDRWADERNRREDQSVAARHVPRDITGYQQLDPHGQWAQDATLGAVWYPHVPQQWAPYRFGQWEWIAPWGWTWMDDAPWAFATSHYGRWSRIDSRWAWVPGRLAAKPVYAPALVAFIGKGDSLAWFPLAPGEAWQPPYKASLTHTGGINRGALPVTGESAPLAHQRRAEALTVISSSDFHRGRPAPASWLRVAFNELSSAQLVPPPPMPQRAAMAATRPEPVQEPAAVRPAAPVAATSVQVASKAPVVVPPPPPAPAPKAPVARPAAKAAAQPAGPAVAAARAQAVQAAQMAQRREQAAREQTARAQALRDKALRLETARRAEQAQKAQLAKKAEQVRRIEIARREADAKRLAAAQQEARAWQLALAQVQANRQAQARREDQARRVAQARRQEQVRLEARSQWLEQARRSADREAQSLRDQQAQREERAQREALAQRESNERERARREAQEREQARFEAWQRQQQALSEKLRRDQQLWEQARERTRQPPAQDRRYLPPEWQRIPVVPSRVL